MRARLLLPFLLFLAPAGLLWAQGAEPTERPFLWRIEGETPSYLYGTVHVPDPRVTNVPKVVGEAIDTSDAFFAELAMDQLAGAEGKMRLPGGKTLKDVLPDEHYQRFEAYLETVSASAFASILEQVPPQQREAMQGMFKRQLLQALGSLKPWAAGSQLTMLHYMPELQMGAQPLDAALYGRAKSKGKEVGGLETFDEQLAVFDSLDDEEQVAYFGQTLDSLEKAAEEGKRPTDELVEIYLTGDAEALEQKAMEEFKADDPGAQKFLKLLLTDRNVRMADRIAEKIEADRGKGHFFAIGALHHPGKGGIIELLEAKGFELTRLSAADAGKLQREPVGAGAGD